MLRYSPAQVLCSGGNAGPGECHIAHVQIPHPKNVAKPPDGQWPDMRGLHELQFSRDVWLNGDAIEKAISIYYQSLPTVVQDMVQIQDTSLTGLFIPGKAGEERFQGRIIRPMRGFFRAIREKEYTLWPINYNDSHWVLVLIRKRRPAENSDQFTHISRLAIIDSWKDGDAEGRKRFIHQRLLNLFHQAGNFTFSDSYDRTIWTPWQKDACSCGPRVYWAARQILNRLLRAAELNLRTADDLWDPLSGFFNEEQVRWEMTGLNAFAAVQQMGYRARIAVELVNEVKSSGRDGLDTYDAAEMMRPPPRLPEIEDGPNRKRKRPTEDTGKADDEDDELLTQDRRHAGVAGRNRRRVAPSYSPRENYRAYVGDDDGIDPIFQGGFQPFATAKPTPRTGQVQNPGNPLRATQGNFRIPPRITKGTSKFVPAGERKLFADVL
ncbi:hypothetical protein GGS23DRAFT_578118 [Durotheca rogersii]|uniref:uncharacterized protein n=1 Tax=Durotheca rogersii TaxID=419775 RepID=UPI00221ECDF1|nr:uncharacterized protein GGS23DRAFT_578118 [Durotheca rogersii]KAI5860955.1 hypothetical protein GGS23DRAFT_578118 [Durotheca rogersii]